MSALEARGIPRRFRFGLAALRLSFQPLPRLSCYGELARRVGIVLLERVFSNMFWPEGKYTIGFNV